MALIDLSSLNSINERHTNIRSLRQAQKITHQARVLLLEENKLVDLPNFSAEQLDAPCSEDLYFEIIEILKKELNGEPGVFELYCKFGVLGEHRSGIMGEEFGYLEIIKGLGERGYIRHEFVLKNDNLKEIYGMLMEFIANWEKVL